MIAAMGPGVGGSDGGSSDSSSTGIHCAPVCRAPRDARKGKRCKGRPMISMKIEAAPSAPVRSRSSV